MRHLLQKIVILLVLKLKNSCDVFNDVLTETIYFHGKVVFTVDSGWNPVILFKFEFISRSVTEAIAFRSFDQGLSRSVLRSKLLGFGEGKICNIFETSQLTA